MHLNESDLWKQLLDYDILKIDENTTKNNEVILRHTENFSSFINNMNRALFPYPFICYYLSESDFFEPYFIQFYDNVAHHYLIETVLISLVTALEIYLRDNFIRMSDGAKVKILEEKKLNKFLKEFMLKDKYSKAWDKYGNDMLLSELIPDRMDFQQKNKSRTAYNLFSIYLPEIVDEKQKTWERIFGNPNGYIKIRNEILHAGFFYSEDEETINLELITNAILDITNFVYSLDNLIMLKYPKNDYPNLYPL